jgi:cobalt-zinc-cadmium efflux system outer membrane protein
MSAHVAIIAQTPSTPSQPQPLTLDAAFARALDANPDIRAARLRRAIDLSGVAVAAERPNPEAHLEIEKETPKQSFGVALPMELGGKRSRRIAVARAALDVGEAELARIILDVRVDVRRAYFAAVVAEARRAVIDELRQFASRARDAAQARFDSGSAPRLEVLQAQLVLAEAENEVSVTTAAASAATVRLNTLLGLPPANTVHLTTAVDSLPAVAADVAIERARAANAELAVLDRQIAEQRAKLTLARAMKIPDVTPDVTVTRDAEPEFMYGWRIAAAASIPLFTTHRAGVQLEQSTLAQLTAQREALVNRVTGEVTSAAAIAEAQRLAYQRYSNEVLPQAALVERMAEDSYRLGQTGITALLQAMQASRDVRLRSLETAESLQDAVGTLERAIGAPLP